MSIANPPLSKSALPTHLDLPCDDGKPVDNFYQPIQADLLSTSLTPWLDVLHPASDYVIGANNGIYWAITDDKISGARAPDWFYVSRVPRMLNGVMRRSYVYWDEKVSPTLVVEFVSKSGDDERDDSEGGKFWVYEQAIKAAFYAIWDPKRKALEVHELIDGRYRRRTPNESGRVSIPPMRMELGTWQGFFRGYTALWLRAWDDRGQLLASTDELAASEKQRADTEKQRADTEKQRADTEKQRADTEKQRAETEQQRAETEKQRAETEKQRADKLAARMRELGIDPGTL